MFSAVLYFTLCKQTRSQGPFETILRGERNLEIFDTYGILDAIALVRARDYSCADYWCDAKIAFVDRLREMGEKFTWSVIGVRAWWSG